MFQGEWDPDVGGNKLASRKHQSSHFMIRFAALIDSWGNPVKPFPTQEQYSTPDPLDSTSMLPYD